MFGELFGPSTSQLLAAIREEQEFRVALYLALVKKGVLTVEEYRTALIQAKSELEQFAAKQQEEHDAAHPEEKKTREFFDKLIKPRPATAAE